MYVCVWFVDTDLALLRPEVSVRIRRKSHACESYEDKGAGFMYVSMYVCMYVCMCSYSCLPILFMIGSVNPPNTIVVKMTTYKVVDMYNFLFSPGMFCDCMYVCMYICMYVWWMYVYEWKVVFYYAPWMNVNFNAVHYIK